MLRGLIPLMRPLMCPLMGLLALGAPLLAEARADWRQSASASQRRLVSGLATDSSRFFHPLAALFVLAAAGSASSNHVQAHPSTLLGWDALQRTSLGGSIWMVRDRWMAPDDGRAGLDAPYSFLLRC